MVGREYPTKPREASGLDPEAVHPWAYGVGAGLSALGAVGYAAGVFLPADALVVAALALAGAGQTKGIVAAIVAY